MHIAESKDDVENCLEKYGKKIIERLDNFGLLNMNSILSHCVHISKDEAEIISNKKCLIALNPTSNMNNSVGLPDYALFKKYGIKCLLGNDGLGSNITRDYSNIVFSMKYKLGRPTEFGLEDLAEIINNGYEYIGSLLNIKIGKIERGYKADLVALPYVPPTHMDENNALSHIFFGVFDNFHPRDVWISGRRLLRDFNLTFDEEKIFSKAREEAQRVWDRVQKS
jgi:cytosine/adenosine deaminase-related metal-dependent hydrolase